MYTVDLREREFGGGRLLISRRMSRERGKEAK